MEEFDKEESIVLSTGTLDFSINSEISDGTDGASSPFEVRFAARHCPVQLSFEMWHGSSIFVENRL
jgi:hypothetical protein